MIGNKKPPLTGASSGADEAEYQRIRQVDGLKMKFITQRSRAQGVWGYGNSKN